MAVDQKVSKWMRKRGPMHDGELVAPQQKEDATACVPRNVVDHVVERRSAITLANKVLENASLDPDGDLSVLARQFLRETERFASVLEVNAQARDSIFAAGEKWARRADALEEENARMRGALQFIASQEPLTFAECSVAEAIIGRAKTALEEG